MIWGIYKMKRKNELKNANPFLITFDNSNNMCVNKMDELEKRIEKLEKKMR